MSTYSDLQDRTVYFQSGTETLTGKVTRTSDASVWVTFPEIGEFRFGMSQDGRFRRHGHTTNEQAAHLVFSADDEDATVEQPKAEVLPVQVPEKDFSETVAKHADIVWRLAATVRGWQAEDDAARAKVADPKLSLSPFTLESLLKAAGTEAPRYTIRRFMQHIEGRYCLTDDKGKVTEVFDGCEEQFIEAVEGFKEHLTDQFTEWYQPNSTSNVAVEIKLNQHAAWQQAMKVAQGKRF